MRRIDADALLKEVDRLDEIYGMYGDNVFLAGIECVREKVMNAPTIDAEPVRHGKWIPTDLHKSFGVLHGVECSLCGEQMVYAKYKHCPNCGARMDFEEE